MTKQLMDSLVAAGDEAGVEIRARNDYSGRGMYGRTTCGVVAESLVALLPVVAVAASHMAAAEAVEQLIRELRDLSTDSMGHDVIVY